MLRATELAAAAATDAAALTDADAHKLKSFWKTTKMFVLENFLIGR